MTSRTRGAILKGLFSCALRTLTVRLCKIGVLFFIVKIVPRKEHHLRRVCSLVVDHDRSGLMRAWEPTITNLGHAYRQLAMLDKCVWFLDQITRWLHVSDTIFRLVVVLSLRC